MKHTNPSYVIFKRGSKQYRVTEGDVIDVDLFDAEKGSQVNFDEVLFVGHEDEPLVGLPAVKGYHVACEVVGESKGPKITSIKYKPNHTQCRKFGHRQRYTRVKVFGISKAK
jgi:large subunit ribosomal protein L21